MSKLNTAWVVATSNDAVPGLTNGARTLAENVVLFTAGDESGAMNADKAIVMNIASDASASAAASCIADRAKAEAPDVILVESCKNGRLIAASIAVALDSSIIADPAEITVVDGAIQSRRMVYGGGALKTEIASATAVVTVAPGNFEVVAKDPASAIETIEISAPAGIKVVSVEDKPSGAVDLSAEKIVVGVGRGMGSIDGAPAVREFAAAIGAGIGCSRPVGEEEHWFGDTGYLGISGDHIKPDVYIAAGISGQVQHMVGVTGTGTIFAINKDKNATIFGECDYGIVGDMNVVIPALTKKFQQL